MCGEFSEIFQLCSEVLQKANKPSLIKATLNTLLRFLNWIPLGYIFETNLVENLRLRVSLRVIRRVRISHAEHVLLTTSVSFYKYNDHSS